MTEIIGYTGMILLTYGFFIKERSRMHLLLLIAALVLGVYSFLISSIPFVILNIISAIINGYRFFEFR